MNKQDAKKRIDKLIVQIDDLRYRYHVLDDPTVTDAVYDSLSQELKELEQEFPDLQRSDSPLQRVGGKPLGKFEKVHHEVRQWSFNDAFDKQEIYDWEQRIKKMLEKKIGRQPKLDYVCELKIDGLHIVFTYQKGLLKLAATRGDGVTGENVTQNIKTIQSVPLRLKKAVDMIAEGEVWLSQKQLENINKQRKKTDQPEFANPRNAAAGTIRQLDPKIVAARKLDCFVYDWSGGKDTPPPTQAEELEALKKLGFKVNQHYKHCKDIKAVIDFWQLWEKKRDGQPYWIDGIVVKVNSSQYQQTLGYIGKAPRWVLAVKFAAEEATTIVEDIQVQIGRLGTLTPVAHLRPVKLAGTTVKRATLHNEDQIKRLDVRIGDTVVVRKAGDIIPEVVSVLPKMRTGKEKKFVMPKVYKGIKVVRKEGESAHVLADINVAEVLLQRLIHFVSKKAFNIEGLGDKIVEQLMAVGLVGDPADFFSLKKDDLVGLERFAEKSADNLVESIAQAKEITLARFIYALGIKHVGEETAIDLADVFGNLEDLKKVSLEKIESIPDIGPIVAKSIYQFFQNKNNLGLLDKLEKAGVSIQVQKIKKFSGALTGKKIVVTGILESMSRDQVKEKIRNAGGDWVGSVSKNTDYVVAGQDPGSKLKKAKQLGVKVIDEKELLKLLK